MRFITISHIFAIIGFFFVFLVNDNIRMIVFEKSLYFLFILPILSLITIILSINGHYKRTALGCFIAAIAFWGSWIALSGFYNETIQLINQVPWGWGFLLMFIAYNLALVPSVFTLLKGKI